MSTPSYEQDFYAWALESARGLRETAPIWPSWLLRVN
jgi:hypothetical protein